jgi:alginate O-acetyltransferase complex protein AlgI
LIFTEVRFLLFFGLAFVVYWSLRGNTARKWWLLLGSYVFYGAWDWRFLFLLFGSTLLDYAVGRGLAATDDPRRRKWLLACSIVGNIGTLCLFKYYDFFVSSGAWVLNLLGLEVQPRLLNLILPVGISFYTFQTLSYGIDAYRRALVPVRSFLDFSLYVSFFPQLVAGPIVRAIDFLPQLARRRQWSDVNVRACLILFLVGYVKKACISDNIAANVDAIFSNWTAYGIGDLWLGSALFLVRTYCDFSGYSDMAIATAGLLGYELLINFDFPFVSRSMSEFWRRWHISLVSWLRDYLYLPLGGGRKGLARMVLNLWIVFFLTGLWHGANWACVVWGLFFGLVVFLENAIPWSGAERLPAALRHAYVILLACVGCTLFASNDLGVAVHYVGGMFSGGAGAAAQASLDDLWWLVIAAFGVGHVLAYRRTLAPAVARLNDWQFAVGYGLVLALMFPWVAPDYQAFIYFQF